MKHTRNTTNFIVSALKNYPELKPREAEFRRQLDDAVNAARLAAMPRLHAYVLTQLPVPRGG
jgi:hypothetical protein